jgi:PncC family amidohydrolase
VTSAAELLDALRQRALTLGVAEGDTGGVLLQLLTEVPGSSAVVLGGVVAYADRLKTELLYVPDETIREHGSVSRQAAEAMATGVRLLLESELGLATTGIAGPGGATPSKPVGLAWVAVTDGRRTLSREHRWLGDRAANRLASAGAAIELAQELLEKSART